MGKSCDSIRACSDDAHELDTHMNFIIYCIIYRPGRKVMAGGVLHPTRWNSIVVFYALFSIMMTNNDVIL